jgi:hypothetical protein
MISSTSMACVARRGVRRSACPPLPARSVTCAALALIAAGTMAPGVALASRAVAHRQAAGTPPTEAGCPIFPASNPLNEEVAHAPVDPKSAGYIAAIGANEHLHPDFGKNPSYGIPYAIVARKQPRVPIHFTEFPQESNPGPYPVPPNAPVEGAGEEGDQHVLVLQKSTCELFELYRAGRGGRGWDAGSGAVFNLRGNALRPEGWTSADAAGLPIFPLLVRYPEVHRGSIDHALRVTVRMTQRGYIHPATHFASGSSDPNLPPMGLRLRLSARFDLALYHGEVRVILEALKRYGLIVADNGSPWFITGAPSPQWNEESLNELKNVPGSAFEAVETGPIRHG